MDGKKRDGKPYTEFQGCQAPEFRSSNQVAMKTQVLNVSMQ